MNNSIVNKSGWEERELGEVVDKVTEKNTEGALPYIGMETIEPHTGKLTQELETKEMKSSTVKFNSLHILYGKLRPYLNKVYIPGFTGHATSEFVPLKPKDNVLREWVAYWLRSPDFVKLASTFTTGTRMPRADIKQIMKCKIPLPPLSEQKRIATKLDTVFSHIKQAKTLRQESQDLADDLLSSALHQVFSQAEQNGWEERELGEVVDKVTEKNTEGALPYIGMETVEPHTGKLTQELETKEMKSSTVKFNSLHILYGKLRPYLNKVYIPGFTGHATSEFVPLKPKDNVLREWVAYWLRSPDFVKLASTFTTGTRMPRADIKQIMKCKIPLPPLEEQHRLVRYLHAIAERATVIQTAQGQTADYLTELEQSLLRKAFEGEL